MERGESKLSMVDEERQNRGEKETNLEETEKVATGKFGCEMKGGKWRRKRDCVGEGG